MQNGVDGIVAQQLRNQHHVPDITFHEVRCIRHRGAETGR
jgi:hypothetical protein